MPDRQEEFDRPTMVATLGYPVFRRMWGASLFTNFGQLIQGVGAAWAMTELTGSADMVALVQTAAFTPLMLFALSAGAVADTYDRRKVGLVSLAIALAGAIGLAASAWLDLLSPALILIFTFLIGSGFALFGPSWQASVSEQVPANAVPTAISLNSISYNIARSFGPAIGGVIVATGGAAAAFSVNALFFLPMVGVLLLWQRVQEPARLPPERLTRAIVSGVRYVAHSPPIRVIIVRTIITGVLGCILSALMPLIARDLLGGDARDYGLMLGAFGIGAVAGALLINRVTSRLSSEAAVRICTLAMAAGIAVVGISRWHLLTAAALIVAGMGWLIAITVYNIGVQTMAPRWVSGRALAAFQASIAGGIAIGAGVWGSVADRFGVDTALFVAAATLIVSLIVPRWFPLPSRSVSTDEASLLDDPEVALDLNPRSGPIVITIEYRVPRHRARLFYMVMQDVQLGRQRNGAYGWSIARDIADPELWTERYHTPTWLDFLRQRNRPTQAERELFERAAEFHVGAAPPRVSRMLERPYGSVRWREDVRDHSLRSVVPVAMPPGAGGT